MYLLYAYTSIVCRVEKAQNRTHGVCVDTFHCMASPKIHSFCNVEECAKMFLTYFGSVAIMAPIRSRAIARVLVNRLESPPKNSKTTRQQKKQNNVRMNGRIQNQK